MRVCPDHWAMCREAVDLRGMSSLVARSGKEAVDRAMEEANGADPKETFDPLMALNGHFWSEALRCGGLYLMGQNETGENGGHYCPVCEFEKRSKGFVAKDAIGDIADQMAAWAREQGLLPEIS